MIFMVFWENDIKVREEGRYKEVIEIRLYFIFLNRLNIKIKYFDKVRWLIKFKWVIFDFYLFISCLLVRIFVYKMEILIMIEFLRVE